MKYTSCYDVIASEYYDSRHITSRNFDATTQRALRELSLCLPAGLVLEIGAGRGRVSEFLGLESSRVVQLDSSKAMLELQDREPCLLKVHADARAIPLCSQQFSSVIGFLVDPFMGTDFLHEAFRMLSCDGTLLLTVPTLAWGACLRQQVGIDVTTTRFRIIDADEIVVLTSLLYSKDEINEMLTKAGFTNIEIGVHCLGRSDLPVSPDILRVADVMRTDCHAIPLIHSIRAIRSCP